MRTWLGLLFGLTFFALVASGCGPALKEEELGTVVFEEEDLPGADQPYFPPDVSQPPAAESETEPTDES